MQKSGELIDVFIGEANDGHAELVEASLRDAGIVNSLHRGIDDAETMEWVRGARRGSSNGAGRPSLILLDCGLPRVGGADVLRALKSDRQLSWIPVIMMTAEDDRQQAEQCRNLGCEAYVTKWTVFLGLPGFVRRVRFLADRAIWIASRRLSAGWSHGYCAGTLGRRSISDATQIYRHGQERISKEVKGESAAP